MAAVEQSTDSHAPGVGAPGVGARAAMARRYHRFGRYGQQLLAVAVVLCGSAVLLNLFVDPLWFWHGNQITGRNFPFNERISRINLLLQDPTSYDCLVFGSSRVGLFDHTKIRDHRCFNMTFSSGNVVEFADYADYLARLGLQPDLVIVGIDDYNYLPELKQAPATPDFVRRHEPPPGILASYFSLDAARLSLRSLFQQSDESRYYDANFVGRVLESAPQFVPPETLEAEDPPERFTPQRIALYRRLRDSFPDATFWGYAPPISAWDVAQTRYSTGLLDDYLDVVSATASLFDAFYDFSTPGPMTQGTDNTYDGSHYFPWVNAIVAERLQSGAATIPADGFGLPVHALSREAYGAAYRAGLERFLASAFPKTAAAAR